MSRRVALAATGLVALLTLTGCFGSSTSEPTTSPQPTAVAQAKDFCGAMSITTEAASRARQALSGLYDEMATDGITSPGADLTVFNAAGADVDAYGTSYVLALEQVRGFADPSMHDDIDAILKYWETYAIPVGRMAAEAESYTTGFVEQARELIESPDTAQMRTDQIEASDNVTREYAKVCSAPE